MKGRRKKKNNISKTEIVENAIRKHHGDITEEQMQQASRFFGLMAGIVSKVFLERGGCVVDYKINGENITDIEKLHALDISDRLKLAVKEERFEDAMNLKKILDDLKKEQKQISE